MVNRSLFFINRNGIKTCLNMMLNDDIDESMHL
jgi:hypothetical protein